MKIKLALAAHNTEKCFESKIFGLSSGSSRIVQRLIDLSPDDILVFYKAKAGFAGIWKVVSEPYSDKTPLWQDGDYSTRVKIAPVIALKPDQYVSATAMVNDLEMVTHPHYYGIAFRENLKDISEKDYKLIKSHLEKVTAKV